MEALMKKAKDMIEKLDFDGCVKLFNQLPKRKVEDSVMGVAIEAEMQGFIYGFKVFEILLNRELATA